MPEASAQVYEPYRWKPEYVGVHTTYGGFAIIRGTAEGLPAVLIKQRNGRGSSPFLWDLPGGGRDNTGIDADLRATAKRETLEEVKIEGEPRFAIGEPLYLPIKKDGQLIRVDCAQAFLLETSPNAQPHITEEALEVAFVNQHSFGDFAVVSRKVHTESPVFGRTPVMIFDGLSIIQPPLWVGKLTDYLLAKIMGDTTNPDFLLMDDGHYLCQLLTPAGQRGSRQIAIYRRLNPDQPDGFFRGSLEDLAGI